ncbi:MAG: family 78 glycoside hydrolase catalytic domain [Kiritimatiellales bacterium]
MDVNYVTGYVRLSDIHAPSGTEITITYADSLDAKNRIDCAGAGAVFYTGSYKLDRYICKGSQAESFEPKFVFRGFRYAEISGLPPGVKPQAEAVNLRTDVARNGEFACSDLMFNDFQSMFVRTLETHMHGIISDNVTRERNQWLGDCMTTRELYSWTFDMQPFWRKIVRDMQTSTESRRIGDRTFTNLVRSSTGSMRASGFSPLWSKAVIWVPWTAYVYYGDLEMLRETYPWMKALMDYCEADGPDGLMKTVMFGDWHEESADSPKNLQPRPASTTPLLLVGNAHYFNVARKMSLIAGVLGNKEDEARYTALAERIRQAVIRGYYDATNRTYGSQSGDAMALAFDLYPDGDREAVALSLAGHVAARDGHLNIGTLNGPLLVQALSETGNGALLYEMFKKETYPGFGFMRAMGSKTVWETWGQGTISPGVEKKGRIESSSRPVSQQALASFGDTLFYRAAAGIHPDPGHPGFKHFFLKPDMKFNAKLDSARASYDSPYGKIVSDWKQADGRFVWNVTIPPNTTATAHIPAVSAESVSEGGQPLVKLSGISMTKEGNKGVKFVKMENNSAICELQSGNYCFEAK